MNSADTVKTWQKAIIAAASAKLVRELTDRERRFITARSGFIALEAISDKVNAESKEFVERYLNSQ